VKRVRGQSLLETLHGLIERTYAMRTGIDDVSGFVLGDDGYRRLYGSRPPSEKVVGAGSLFGVDEKRPRLLLRQAPAGAAMRAAIYYPDALVRRLEAQPPSRGLDERNIDDFAAFVEELDHLLCVAQRVREGVPFSLLELELHANVTKYLAGWLFLDRKGGGPGSARRAWLKYHLFDKLEYSDGDPEVRTRYRDAARYGWRFIAALERMLPEARLDMLREFHRSTHHQKLALVG
jgi:hypothetical protein